MKLNTIKEYFIKSKKSKKILKKKELYFMPGRYSFSARNKKIYYLKNYDTEAFLNNLEKNFKFNKKEKGFSGLKTTIRAMVLGLFDVELTHTSNKFNGQLGMITRSDSIKIFDLEEKKVLTFIENKHEYQIIKTAYSKLNKYYNTTFLEFDDEKLCYSEYLIDFKPSNIWNKKEKELVFDHTYNVNKMYFNEYSELHYKKISVSKKIKEWQMQENIKKTVENCKLLLQKVDVEIPILTLHGDINLNNILLSENKIYFIDFEMSEEYLFFYDILSLIYHEPFSNSWNGEKSYLINYVQGKYDLKLQELFGILNFNYIPELKKEYFILGVLERAAKMNHAEELLIRILNFYDEIETNYKIPISKSS